MKALIIEDELIAAEHLHHLINEYDADIDIVEILDSVSGSVEWLFQNEHPPLIFMDIHLGDGNCFEIFKHTDVQSSVIFTTAYDQYAIQAFKVNSIDYLLKPLNKNDVFAALDKYFNLKKPESSINNFDLSQLLNAIQKPSYKDRFIVKTGPHIRPINTKDIVCFYSLEKATYLVSNEGKHYLIDNALDKVQELLNPVEFFRISRKHIVSLQAIKDVISQSSTRAKVKLNIILDDDLIISRDRIKPFKAWLEGE